LIERYTRAAMGRIWTEENKYRCWLEVETAASTVLAEDGVIPVEAAEAIAAKASFSVKRIQEIEVEVKHDVIAFNTAVAESLAAAGAGAQSRWFHYGLTSNDIAGCTQTARTRVQAHTHDWADAWDSCGADDVWAEAAELVRGDGAEPGAV